MRTAISILMMLTGACCASRGGGAPPTTPEIRYVPQPREQCVTVSRPRRPALTCTPDPSSGAIPPSCDPKIDAARIIDHERVLERWSDYVVAVCKLENAPAWGER